MTMLRAHLAAWALVLAAACSDSDSDRPGASGAFDRKKMLADLVRTVIVPGYREFAREARELDATLREWIENPSVANEAAARGAWKEARIAWKRTEAFGLGPASDSMRRSSGIDFWPARPESIDSFLVSDQVLRVTALDAQGATLRGLPVLEYLLFAPAALVADPEGRRAYLALAAADLVASAEGLVAAWEARGGFAETFAGAGSSVEFPTVTSAIDAVALRLAYVAEKIVADRLGRPLGKRSGGNPEPGSVESRFSDHSLADMEATLEGFARLYGGNPDESSALSFSDFVRHLDPELDRRITEGIGRATLAIRAIPGPLSRAVEDDRGAVETAYRAAKELRTVLAADLAGRLGTTVGFTDSDAD